MTEGPEDHRKFRVNGVGETIEVTTVPSVAAHFRDKGFPDAWLPDMTAGVESMVQLGLPEWKAVLMMEGATESSGNPRKVAETMRQLATRRPRAPS